MKILLITTISSPAAEFIYAKNPGFETLPYQEQKRVVSEQLPNIASSYSLSFSRLGHSADFILADCSFLQEKWAQENRIKPSRLSFPHLARRSSAVRGFASKFPALYYSLKGLLGKKDKSFQILLRQVKFYNPEVLFIFDIHFFTPAFLKEMRKYVKKIIGFISCPVFMSKKHLRLYDALASSYPHYVERFKRMGIYSFHIKHAFDPIILKKIGPQERKYNSVYIGGIAQQKNQKFPDRRQFLEELAKRIKIDFWGLAPALDKDSPIFPSYHGQAWGEDMYKILAQSKIVINKHIGKVAQEYANNLRLYEATGMGTLLVTDMKKNLPEIFEVGKEVIAYKTFEEALEKIKYYLENDKERQEIARAGQKRTLKDHNYDKRAKEILNHLRI